MSAAYTKPLRCPMSEAEWRGPLGYCWGLAAAQDRKKRRSFVRRACPCAMMRKGETK